MVPDGRPASVQPDGQVAAYVVIVVAASVVLGASVVLAVQISHVIGHEASRASSPAWL